MIGLPKPLEQWSSELAIFPEALAVALGQHIRRIDAMIGPLRSRPSSRPGAPDGYAGLSRRGPYERLLTTEWLLADEAPDEFLRRAAMNEHAFFQLATRTPANTQVSIALFDAGPGQLGSPRLVQLAVLIVLARRAAEAEVPFSWGILQRPDEVLTGDVTRTNLQRLLDARTTDTVDSDALATWRARFGRDDDLWFVGTPPKLPVDASRIDIEDVLSLEKSEAVVKVRPVRGEARSTTLPLPDEAIGTRLLRDPFEQRMPEPVPSMKAMKLPKISPASRLAFAQNGRTLMVRLVDGTYGCIPVPNSPRAPPGYTKIVRVPEGELLVGMNVPKKRPVLVTWKEGQLQISGWQSGSITSKPMLTDTPTFHSGLLTPAVCFADKNALCIWVIDSIGKAFATSAFACKNVHPPEIVWLTGGYVDSSVWLVGHNKQRKYCVFKGGSDIHYLGEPVGVGHRAFLGAAPGRSSPPWLAIRMSLTSWAVGSTQRCDETIEIAYGEEVMGVLAMHGRPGLLLLKSDRKGLIFRTAQESTTIAEEPARIVVAASDPGQPQLAYLSFAGDLVIYRYGETFRQVLKTRTGEAS